MKNRAAGIIIEDRKILLMYRYKNGKGEYYTFIGGGVEDGETPEEACIREIKEEASLDVEIDKLFIQSTRYDDSAVSEYFYLIRSYLGTPQLGAGPEVSKMTENNIYRLQWINISDLPHIKLYPEEVAQKIYEAFHK